MPTLRRSTAALAPGAAAPSAPDRRRRHTALAALIAGAAAIGFAPIFVRLSEVGPAATAFWRLLLAMPVLWLWLTLSARGGARSVPAAPRSRPETRADWTGLIVAGLCFAADLAVWHWSLQFTTVANATLLPNFAPVFVTLGAFLLFGERVSRRFLAGLGVALLGAAVLTGQSVALSLSNAFGDALAFLTAVFYAGYILAVGRLRARLSTAAIMVYSGAVTCVALLPVTLLSGEVLWAETAAGWLVLAGLAWLSQAGGQSAIAYALAHLPASFSSVTLLLQPAVAAGLAWLLLGEALFAVQALGAAIILAGILLARPQPATDAGR